MDRVLEIQFSGWTATPKMPFVLSGNAVCLPVPSYSLLLGMLGCCLGRNIEASEVNIGFQYSFDSVGNDLEKRQRLEFDGKKVKTHSKGGDAYLREFHVLPCLTVWINRLDWEDYFTCPIGTPALGRSQDILKIDYVKQVAVKAVDELEISGCMLPFNSNLKIGGQLVQLAEAYKENEEVGGGRTATKTGIFMAIPHDRKAKVKIPHLYQTQEENAKNFYLHTF
ncbi:MAG: hypothetical protein MUE81_04670 [Thermoflexibacter sp.]|jgi:CRISPR-associated protein Cas5t|nr:hypothetical protein [Thermoflexibacter sp.]